LCIYNYIPETKHVCTYGVAAVPYWHLYIWRCSGRVPYWHFVVHGIYFASDIRYDDYYYFTVFGRKSVFQTCPPTTVNVHQANFCA
jgi:hypothetical protein